ncbi:MAG TPA: hypothetical protein VMM93_01780 [Vicinamibacterales bacterium]|nr:hypothetical protein [Vicinamibacterales bacterium]
MTFSRIAGQDAGQEGQGAIAERAGADAVELLLRRLGDESSRPELATAPLIIWGHSAGGQLGSRIASVLSQRTIAFIHYHTNGGVREGQRALYRIPALLFVGGKDAAADAGLAEGAWRAGRLAGAPWTFATEPDADHGNPAHLRQANDLLIPWMTAVVRLRMSPDEASLRPVSERDGWAGQHRTREVSPYAMLIEPRADVSWLPDEASARAWQTVTGRRK